MSKRITFNRDTCTVTYGAETFDAMHPLTDALMAVNHMVTVDQPEYDGILALFDASLSLHEVMQRYDDHTVGMLHVLWSHGQDRQAKPARQPVTPIRRAA